MSADRNCRGLDAFMKFSVAKQRLKIMRNSMINFTISDIDNITTAYSNIEELAVLQNKYNEQVNHSASHGSPILHTQNFTSG